MTRKCLEIVRCSQCHYMVWEALSHTVCTYTDDDPRPSFIVRPSEIPSWCPLKDWPEE